MKKILSIVVLISILVLITGCSLLPKQNNNIQLEAPLTGNCNVFECIKKIKTTDNLETVTKIMGFEGKLINEGTNYKTYKWPINNDKNEAVEVVFYTNGSSISIAFSDEDIKSSKVDFSKYEEIKTALNNKDKLTYKDIKTKFKAEGTLIEKSTTSNRYRWVNEKGRYINATFNNSSGACTMIFGMI